VARAILIEEGHRCENIIIEEECSFASQLAVTFLVAIN